MAQAVDAFINLATATDGTSPGAIKIPQHVRRIIGIISTVSIDGAVTIDIGATFTIKLRGKALPQGDQEICLGGISSNEVGTSVGSTFDASPADYLPVDIQLVRGEDLFIDGAHHGTDLGTPFLSVTLVMI